MDLPHINALPLIRCLLCLIDDYAKAACRLKVHLNRASSDVNSDASEKEGRAARRKLQTRYIDEEHNTESADEDVEMTQSCQLVSKKGTLFAMPRPVGKENTKAAKKNLSLPSSLPSLSDT